VRYASVDKIRLGLEVNDHIDDEIKAAMRELPKTRRRELEFSQAQIDVVRAVARSAYQLGRRSNQETLNKLVGAFRKAESTIA